MIMRYMSVSVCCHLTSFWNGAVCPLANILNQGRKLLIMRQALVMFSLLWLLL